MSKYLFTGSATKMHRQICTQVKSLRIEKLNDHVDL
jgi:hypothetical protein